MLEIRLSAMALSNPSWTEPRLCIGMIKIIGLFVSFLAIKKFLFSSFWRLIRKGKVTAVRRITKTAAKIPSFFLLSF